MSGLAVRMFGSSPEAAAPEVLAATTRLLGALADDMLGPEHGIEWKWGGVEIMCDCCGTTTPARRADWTNDGRYDLCCSCVTEMAR